MKSNSLFHLVSPIGGFLAAFRADSKTEAYVLACERLAAMGRQRGRVRLVDRNRVLEWSATIALEKSEARDFAAAFARSKEAQAAIASALRDRLSARRAMASGPAGDEYEPANEPAASEPLDDAEAERQEDAYRRATAERCAGWDPNP